MKILSSFISGLLFSMGLIISGMTDPHNIVGFLDFLGGWKPALMFVMAGAVSVYAITSRFILKRSAPLFSSKFELPTTKDLDLPLVAGAATFGIGWGLGGFCPGPAVVACATGATDVLIFLVGLLAGMVLYQLMSNSGANQTNSEKICG